MFVKTVAVTSAFAGVSIFAIVALSNRFTLKQLAFAIKGWQLAIVRVEEEAPDVPSLTNCAPKGWINAVRGLCQAIVKKDIQRIKKLVSKSFKIFYSNTHAISRGLEANSSLAKTRHDGLWYPLHAAVLTNDVEIVRLVISQSGVDVQAIDEWTSERLSLDIRKAELGIGESDTLKATPLHYACMVGNTEIIKLLWEFGAEFDKVDAADRTPDKYFDFLVSEDVLSVYWNLSRKWQKCNAFYNGKCAIEAMVTTA